MPSKTRPAPVAPHPDLLKVLVDERSIQKRVAELGAEISADFAGEGLILVCILKGSFIFSADLCRHLTVPVTYGFMAISSYGDDTRTSGVVRIVKDLDQSISGKNVLIVEDIVDTGLTISYILKLFENRNPRHLRICTLLNKPTCRLREVPIDYCGFTIPNEFVVGYGLDYRDEYRNLPCVGVLKPRVYASEHQR